MLYPVRKTRVGYIVVVIIVLMVVGAVLLFVVAGTIAVSFLALAKFIYRPELIMFHLHLLSPIFPSQPMTTKIAEEDSIEVKCRESKRLKLKSKKEKRHYINDGGSFERVILKLWLTDYKTFRTTNWSKNVQRLMQEGQSEFQDAGAFLSQKLGKE